MKLIVSYHIEIPGGIVNIETTPKMTVREIEERVEEEVMKQAQYAGTGGHKVVWDRAVWERP